MKKEYDVLKIYCSLFLVSAIYMFILDMVTLKFNGSMPAELFSPTREVLLIGFVLHIIPLLCVIPIFKKTKNIRISYLKIPKKIWYFDEKKIHIFIFFIMFINLIFAIRTGIGTADSSNRNSFSFLLRIFPPEPLMLLYFVFEHNTKKKIVFWVNFFLYAAFQLSTGWTGFIFQYAFIELFLYVKHGNKIKFNFSILKLSFLCDIGFIVVGGAIYSLLRPLKFAIRYGYAYSGKNTLAEGMANLVSRLTNYEATVVSIINHKKIARLYTKQGIWNWEAVSAFKNVLPRFLMPGKDYRVLGNVLMNSYFPDIESTTSTGYCLITYAWNLFESNIPGFVLWVLMYVLLFAICKRIIQMFDNGNGDSDVLYFFLILEVLQGNPISASLGATYLELPYALILLPLLGIIKKRTRKELHRGIEENENTIYYCEWN